MDINSIEDDLVFMDDVISSGETLAAMRKLVAMALGIESDQLKSRALAVIKESFVNSDGTMIHGYDKNIQYAVQTPVFSATDDVGIFNVMPYVSYPHSNDSVPYLHPRTADSEPLHPSLAVPLVFAPNYISITES